MMHNGTALEGFGKQRIGEVLIESVILPERNGSRDQNDRGGCEFKSSLYKQRLLQKMFLRV